jgi:hypothetical protein
VFESVKDNCVAQGDDVILIHQEQCQGLSFACAMGRYPGDNNRIADTPQDISWDLSKSYNVSLFQKLNSEVISIRKKQINF